MKKAPIIILGEQDILQAGFVATLDKSGFKISRNLSYRVAITWRRQELKPGTIYLAIESVCNPKSAKEAITAIRREDPEACVVVITTSSNETGWAFEAGADGCLPHTISARALIAAIDLLACKEVTVGMRSATSKREIDLDYIVPSRTPLDSSNMTLSLREREVLACVARGESNKRIARALQICEATVKGHVRTVLRKIGASNRTQAAVMASELLPPLLLCSTVDGHC